MNNVIIIGRLTADPELKYTPNDVATTRFSIAVDRPYAKAGQERQTDFINIIAWRQTAEFICKYFQKGNRIAIIGQIRTGSYTDTNGNNRYTFEVQADSVEFCESKRSSAYSSGSNNGFRQLPTGEDLPF